MKPSSLFSPGSWRKRNQKPTSNSPERTSVFTVAAGRIEKPLPECPTSFGISNDSAVSLHAGDKKVVNSLPDARQPPHIHVSINSSSPNTKFRSLKEIATASCIDVPSTLVSPPRRPPRPPSLNLTAPPIAPSLSCPETPSPRVSCQHPKPLHAQTSNLASKSLKTKRSMPELDGVWKGFLADVDEDANSIHLRPDEPSSRGKSLHMHHRSASRHHIHGGSNALLPLVDRSSTDSRSRSIPQKPKLPNQHHSSESSPYLPHTEEYPSLPSLTSMPVEITTDFSLSLFPAPPPLIIRHKAPKPLVLRPTPTIAPLPPSPNPGSSDSTPVATPTTPTPTQLLQSPRKKDSPVSILKKSSSCFSSPTSTPTSSTFSPIHVNHNDSSPPPDYLRPTRLVQSVSHPPPAFSCLSAAHRATSSDSLSDCSSSGSHRSRLLTSQSFPKSYLQVSGRVPTHRSRSPPQVEYGIAV